MKKYQVLVWNEHGIACEVASFDTWTEASDYVKQTKKAQAEFPNIPLTWAYGNPVHIINNRDVKVTEEAYNKQYN